MISNITIAGQTINLVALPALPFRSYEFQMSDAVAMASSEFTGQQQAQQWPGADRWTGTVEPPDVAACDAGNWKAFMAQMRGMANAFQLTPPDYQGPQGNPLGAPAIPASVTDVAGSQTLHTAGWQASAFDLLLPGDYMQVGYRLHMVLNPVNSDSGGNAAIEVWPSLREAPIAGFAIILDNPQGLFRLGANKRGWSAGSDYMGFSKLSFPITEYR